MIYNKEAESGQSLSDLLDKIIIYIKFKKIYNSNFSPNFLNTTQWGISCQCQQPFWAVFEQTSGLPNDASPSLKNHLRTKNLHLFWGATAKIDTFILNARNSCPQNSMFIFESICPEFMSISVNHFTSQSSISGLFYQWLDDIWFYTFTFSCWYLNLPMWRSGNQLSQFLGGVSLRIFLGMKCCRLSISNEVSSSNEQLEPKNPLDCQSFPLQIMVLAQG